MYSYEDRIRAERLYLKLGKRIRATIRQLGYPTKGALTTWCREYRERGDLHFGFAPRRPKYSDEQKRVAVEHYLNHGRCVSVTLRALGYPSRAVMTDWVRELFPGARKYAVGKSGRPPHAWEAKQSAVFELCSREESAVAIAHKLDVDRVTLYNWKNQLLGRDAPASMKRQKEPPEETDKAALEQQVDTLRREIRRLQLDHDLLKKASELIKKTWASTCDF